MNKKSLLLGTGVLILLASFAVGVSLYLQGGLTARETLVLIVSALIGTATLISGVKDASDLVTKYSRREIEENRKVTTTTGGNSVSFSVSTPESGDSFRTGSVIEAHGKHALPASSFVWALLSDVYGNFYLQNPPVVLLPDETWRSTNLHLGHDIIEIIFVKVTRSGNDVFLDKVRNNDWGAFHSWPAGSERLTSLRIRVG